MNTLIIYKTKWGSTEQYARWLHEEIDGDLRSEDRFPVPEMERYDTVVLFSRTFMGKIQLTGFLEKHWAVLKTKKVILVAVGMIPEEKSRDSFELIPDAIRTHIRIFKLPGKLELKNLNWLEKKITKKVAGELRDIDGVRKSRLRPVLDYLSESRT